MSLLQHNTPLDGVARDKKVIISKTVNLLRYIQVSQKRLSAREFKELLSTFWEVYQELGDTVEDMDYPLENTEPHKQDQ